MTPKLPEMTPALAQTIMAVTTPPQNWRRSLKRTEPWTAAEIAAKLESSDKMVERSLLQLYYRQTSEEQAAHDTVERNGMGFNAYDAAFLTDLAQWIERSTYPEGQRLTPKQMPHARKALKKYVGQLTRIANGE